MRDGYIVFQIDDGINVKLDLDDDSRAAINLAIANKQMEQTARNEGGNVSEENSVKDVKDAIDKLNTALQSASRNGVTVKLDVMETTRMGDITRNYRVELMEAYAKKVYHQYWRTSCAG